MRGLLSRLEQADSGEDDEILTFKPLDSKFSYSATPKALEVVPTQYIEDGHTPSNDKKEVRFDKNNGLPVEKAINTRHVSGKKIDRKHAQYALSAGMMLGVRECVGGISDLAAADDADNEGKKPLTLEEECLRVEKFKIPAGAYFISSQMASLPYGYKFKAYAPEIFHRIRDMAGVEKQLFLHSICGSDAFIEFVSNAKSGQFFFYSHDGRYMIKTQTQEEKTFLRQILPDYYNHLKENPHSFLTHFYGMYRVKIPDLGKSVHFVIMKSVFNTELEIHKIWDLKGSTLGRRSNRGDSVHKDLDIMDEGRKICVGPKAKDAMMSTLKNDAAFLAKMHIMDYSLLLGVHLATSSVMQEKRSILARTNTPMRRKTLFGDESVMQHFMNGAKAIFSHSAETASQTTSIDTTSSYDEDTDDESDRDAPFDGDMNTTLSYLDVEKYHQEKPPNPFTSREDFGIESKNGNDIKEVYFAGKYCILTTSNFCTFIIRRETNKIHILTITFQRDH
jgi:1-phosphatidylinositol-4-phosphate 5-kinase